MSKPRDWKNVFTLYIFPLASHIYDFVVPTSLTHQRKIILVVLHHPCATNVAYSALEDFLPLRCVYVQLSNKCNFIFIVKFNVLYSLQIFSVLKIRTYIYNTIHSYISLPQCLCKQSTRPSLAARWHMPCLLFCSEIGSTLLRNVLSHGVSCISARWKPSICCIFNKFYEIEPRQLSRYREGLRALRPVFDCRHRKEIFSSP
jgi:hypothetical protein